MIKWYCRNQRKELEADNKLNHLIQDLKLRNHVTKTKVKKEPVIGRWGQVKTPNDKLEDRDFPIEPVMENVSGDTDWNDPVKQNKLISQQNSLLSYITGLGIGVSSGSPQIMTRFKKGLTVPKGMGGT